jgi:hypothetical protein
VFEEASRSPICRQLTVCPDPLLNLDLMRLPLKTLESVCASKLNKKRLKAEARSKKWTPATFLIASLIGWDSTMILDKNLHKIFDSDEKSLDKTSSS